MSIYTLKPDIYSSHMKIIEYLSKIDYKKLKILDVGCSKGFIGKSLYKNHDFYGIDLSFEDAKIARKYYKQIKILDIEKKKPVYPNRFFDIIIMADIIEHLKDPLVTILYFKKFLKKGGLIILSVPNIANIYVRFRLLLGNLDYQDRGILDKTHLRFFTFKSLRELIYKSRLIIVKEEITPIPLPTINRAFSKGNLLYFIHKINYLLAISWRSMFSFQFIMYCRIK